MDDGGRIPAMNAYTARMLLRDYNERGSNNFVIWVEYPSAFILKITSV